MLFFKLLLGLYEDPASTLTTKSDEISADGRLITWLRNVEGNRSASSHKQPIGPSHPWKERGRSAWKEQLDFLPKRDAYRFYIGHNFYS